MQKDFQIDITINGKSYPCRSTMGALVRYKRETGKEYAGMKPGDVSDFCIWLYCCLKSACNADKIEFPFATFYDFADCMSDEDLVSLSKQIQDIVGDADAEEEEKKSRVKKKK